VHEMKRTLSSNSSGEVDRLQSTMNQLDLVYEPCATWVAVAEALHAWRRENREKSPDLVARLRSGLEGRGGLVSFPWT